MHCLYRCIVFYITPHCLLINMRSLAFHAITFYKIERSNLWRENIFNLRYEIKIKVEMYAYKFAFRNEILLENYQ